MSTKLSMVIPTYKGAEMLRENLPGLIAYLSGLSISYEIIVVDDGSQDGGKTEEVAREFGCRYFANEKNLGKGAALRKGMLNAGGEFRIFTDVDIPYEYSAIERFTWYLDFKEFHMVVGDRTLANSDYYRDVPWVRSLGSRFFKFIIGRFIVTGMYDTQCGIKGFRADVAEDIFGVSRINRFAIDVELIYIAMKRNYDLKRLPVTLRHWGDSQLHIVRDGIAMFWDFAQIIFNHYKGNYAPKSEVKFVDPYAEYRQKNKDKIKKKA